LSFGATKLLRSLIWIVRASGGFIMEKRYFLGIDGGGTKTEMVLVDETGNIAARALGGTSSIDTIPLAESMKTIRETFQLLGIKAKISAIFAGIGGIASRTDSQKYTDGLRSLPFVETGAAIRSENDVFAALASGKGILEGMTLILGTGSVCFGINKNGDSWRCGGYHFKEGDCGSAFDLGFHALQYYARVLDGRLEPSEFSNTLKNHLKIDDFSHLVTYFEHLNRTEVAKIAPIVTGFGVFDQYAYKILVDAAEEVRSMVEGVYRHLGFDATTVSIIGGAGTAKTLYRQLVFQNIKKISSNIDIIESKYNPAHALALLAKELPAGKIR
jgi:N-acetylglucosamine kinase-like BadF-type ATPase